jgi:hypothetical protein
LLIQDHMADIMTKVAFSAGVTGLATVVAGLCEGFEGPSAVVEESPLRSHQQPSML